MRREWEKGTVNTSEGMLIACINHNYMYVFLYKHVYIPPMKYHIFPGDRCLVQHTYIIAPRLS